MKHIASLFLAAGLATAAFAQNNDKEPYMTKDLSGAGIKDVEVETSGGSISVTGEAGGKARVEVYITGNNSRDQLSRQEIQDRLAKYYDLDITTDNNKLKAIAKRKHDINDWKKSLSISFRVYVAREVSTDLSTSGGSISLKNLSGKENFSTSGGSLSLDDVSGTIDGRTSGGSISVSNSHDDIELSTSGGSIEASKCEGKLRLSTSGGSLDLQDLKGDIRATTSGGSIHGSKIEGELISHTSGGSIHFADLRCSVETSTSGGNIDVEITQLGKYVKVNSSGNISITLPKDKGLDLDLSGRMSGLHLDNFNGKFNENEITGKLNGGGVPVHVDAGGGRISLALK